MRLSLAVGFLTAAASHAQNQNPLDVRGFVSTAVTDTTTSFYMPDLGSTGNRLSFTKNTIFGLNLRWTVNSEWSAMGQIVARGNYDNFGINVNWGFAEWKIHPKFILKLGRVVSPLWLYSQQFDIAASYPWVVLPTEVYGLANILRSIDGVSFLIRQPVGEGLFQIDLIAGTSRARQEFGSSTNPSSIEIDIDSAWGAEISYELQDELLFRLAYDQAYVTGNSIQRGTAATVNPGITVPVDYALPLNVGRTELFASGIRYQSNWLHFNSEWVRRLSENSDFSRASGWYASAGVPIGQWLPYFLYSSSYDVIGRGARHPNPALAAANVFQTGGHTLSTGLNWNASDSVVIKSQVGHSVVNFTNSIHDFNYNFIQLGAAVTF